MKEMDGGKLSHESLGEIRMRAVKRVEAGESSEVVIEALKGRKAAGPAPKLDGKQLRHRQHDDHRE